MQALSGYKIKDTMTLKARVSRTGSGIPRIIPRDHRRLIRSGDLDLVKFYLSLWSVFREMRFDGDLSINSITDSPRYREDKLQEYINYIPTFIDALRSCHISDRSLNRFRPEFEMFAINKSSPFALD
jgi:hypothetical protein